MRAARYHPGSWPHCLCPPLRSTCKKATETSRTSSMRETFFVTIGISKHQAGDVPGARVFFASVTRSPWLTTRMRITSHGTERGVNGLSSIISMFCRLACSALRPDSSPAPRWLVRVWAHTWITCHRDSQHETPVHMYLRLEAKIQGSLVDGESNGK